MSDNHGFSLLGEYLKVVKRAGHTGEVDPRLKPVPNAGGGLTEAELARLEQLADDLDPPETSP